MKLNQSQSDSNVDIYTDAIKVAQYFPSTSSRRYGTSNEILGESGESLLAAIHDELGDWRRNERAALKEWNDQQKDLEDAGLTTEINTSKSCDNISDTMDRIHALFRRHPFGFAGGFHRVEDKTGYKRHLREQATGGTSDKVRDLDAEYNQFLTELAEKKAGKVVEEDTEDVEA